MKCPHCGTQIYGLFARDRSGWKHVAYIDGAGEHLSYIKGVRIAPGTELYCPHAGCLEPVFIFDTPKRSLASYRMEAVL